MTSIKTKQDIFDLLQEQYGEITLRDSDVTCYSYSKKLGISWKQARRLLEKAVADGLLVRLKVLSGTGSRVNKYIPAPGWEKKVNGNIFAQVSSAEGYKPDRNSNGVKKKGVRGH